MDESCSCHKLLASEIENFLRNVDDVKEESITDYLMWKWKEADPRFKCVRAIPHNRHKEHYISGADFELELWILGNTRTMSLAVQAKKFMKAHDSYVNKIKYPKNTSKQIDKLISYSKNENNPRIPVYFLYSIPFESKTLCKYHYKNSGVFVVSANEMKIFSEFNSRTELSLDTILDKSHSLACYFCHDEGEENKFFRYLGFNEDIDNDVIIPDYVNYISSGGISNTNLPKAFRWIGVYDLRDKNE